MNIGKGSPEYIYMKVLRIGAGAVAILLWYVSVEFSVNGFSITLPEMMWIGYVLAITVTILQLIFNKGVYENPTLFLAGLLAYLYGYATNVIGIMGAQQTYAEISSNIVNEPISSLPKLIMPLTLGAVLEIVPEPLLIWALFMNRGKFGDFVTSMASGTKIIKKKGSSHQHNKPQQHQRSHAPQPPPNFSNAPQQFGGQGPAQAGLESQVLAYAQSHKARTGNLPSVRDVAKRFKIGKTKVSEIMKPLR